MSRKTGTCQRHGRRGGVVGWRLLVLGLAGLALIQLAACAGPQSEQVPTEPDGSGETSVEAVDDSAESMEEGDSEDSATFPEAAEEDDDPAGDADGGTHESYGWYANGGRDDEEEEADDEMEATAYGESPAYETMAEEPHGAAPPSTELPEMEGPPPYPPPPPATGTTTLERYPSIFAPDTAAYGTTFEVEVQLTEELQTPEVDCVECGPMVLPEAESWDIDVILSGEGFEAREGREKSLVLRPRGDSTSAVFRLRALPSSADQHADQLLVSFWHGGAFLMQAARPIVYHDPSVPPPTVEAAAGDAPTHATAFEISQEKPDLTIMVNQRQVSIMSPYLTVKYDALELAEHFDAWLESRYAQLSAAGRGFRSAAETPTPSRVAKRLGRDLYQLTPEMFRTALWMLLDNPEIELRTIQIVTDDPRFPWELVLPARADGSDERDFLGLDHTVGRWHVRRGSRMTVQAQGRMGLEETVVVAPNYDPPLVAVASELEDLAAFAAGTAPLRRVDARRTAVEALLDAPRPGIIHFAGHGLASVVGDAGPRFSLELEDGPLYLDAVRGGERWQRGIHPFIFVNACDVGRADRHGGFVEGWAPALLDAGAIGYLGALWPVGDAAAADFAEAFYDRLEESIVRGRGRVATAVRDARRRYHREPDPSYLAYVYYGNVGLQFSTLEPEPADPEDEP